MPLSFTEHGASHGHSHGGFSRSHTRLTHLVATDDNENDETFRPPVPPPPSSVLGADRKKDGRCQQSHSHNNNDASQMNMRGVFLHVLADALGSVIVIASAIVSTIYKILLIEGGKKKIEAKKQMATWFQSDTQKELTKI